MKIRDKLPLWLVVLSPLLLLTLNPYLLRASTIVTEVPGNTVVSDPTDDLLLKKCDPAFPDRACSLGPGVVGPPFTYFGFTDITQANITALPGNGLVEMAITLNGAVPESPTFSFLSYFWQFENGCVGSQPGPTDKDGARVAWNGSIFTANWFVITSCDPREVQAGPPLAFNFSSDRKTVRVQVDMCDLVGRGGDSLAWYAGVRRLRFADPTFTNTFSVDVAPDVIAFNPTPPPTIIPNEDPAPWDGACLGIDIKPGSFPNSINPNNEGRIPVAILSTTAFDAPSRVDQTSLTFGRTGDEASLDFCSGAEDVNGDGLLDLVCHFNTQATGFQKGDTQGILKGLTVGLNPIFLLARDSVRIVPTN